MRFINTHTLQFERVNVSETGKDDTEAGTDKNKYAIFSHRWGKAEEEVSFEDINESRDFSHKQAFAKLKGFCDLAVSLGYHRGWVDTCCIDQTNLTELTEAITSMYRWYHGSDLCIVYLADFENNMLDDSWWSRGWTLQELIAPETVSFYDCHWRPLGTKIELLSAISNKTGIPEDTLSSTTIAAACSVAQRMSWAAKRETTKVEDRAYSLLGIFGLVMPLIYGEGENAFRRLQDVIIQKSKDESIFAWGMGIEQDKRKITGLFALSPSSFVDCDDIISTRGSTGFEEKNGELRICLKTFPYRMETYYAALNCTLRTRPDARISILISRLENNNEYVRVNKAYVRGKILLTPSSLEGFKARDICVSLNAVERPLNHAYGFWLRTIQPPGHIDCQIKILSRRYSSEKDKVCLDDNDRGTAGIVSIEPKVKMHRDYDMDPKGWSRIRWIKLGFDEDFNPMLFLANDNGLRYNSAQRLLLDEEFEQARASESGSEERNKIFHNRWITSLETLPSRSYGWSSGISILKVDKKKGISRSLEALNLGISVHLAPERSPYHMPGESTDEGERKIWIVEITDTDGNDPERDLAKAVKDRSNQECLDCLCSGWDEAESRSTNAIANQREIAHSQPRVLTGSDLQRLN